MEWAGLNDIECVMMVYDELGGDTSSVLSDLVSPYRKLIRIDDVQVREAPFSQNKKADNRLYLFRDLLILGKPSGSMVNGDNIFSKVVNATASVITRKISSASNTALKFIGSGTSTVSGAKGKYKVNYYLDLHKCHIKPITNGGDNSNNGIYGFEITYISRESIVDSKTGKEKFITKIEKIEITSSSQEINDELFTIIQEQIDEIEEMEFRTRESNLSTASMNTSTIITSDEIIATDASIASSAASATNAITPEPKKREWAKKRSTMKLSVNRKSMDGIESTTESVAGLSLADIEARYHLKFTSTTLPSEKAEFEVQFGDGPMGLALGSSVGLGVVVGKLAHGGFAEMAGVAIGDRILSLNDKDIDVDVPWQKVVDDIKTLPRPIIIKFERLAARQQDNVNEEHEEAASTATGTPATSTSGTPSVSHQESPGGEAAKGGLSTPTPEKGLSKQRSWMARRTQTGSNGTTKLMNLQELEKMYKAPETNETEAITVNGVFEEVKKNAHENEGKCLHVLKEIYTTEKLYVEDLRTLVLEYIVPLRRTVRRSRCKDVEGGSTICEHNLIRSTCTKMSHETHLIMSANDMRDVFLNVETLVSINSELLNVLEKELVEIGKKCQSDGKKLTLGSIVAIYAPAFVKVMPFFKMYSIYCHKYASAAERLQEIRETNAEIDDFLSQKEKKSQKTSLKSLLIKPVQRICKYPLLFNELLRSIPQSADFTLYNKELTDAAHAVDEIAETVNKKVGDREAVEKIMEVYEELGGEQNVPGLITAHRRFIHHNNVLLTVVGDKETKKDHTLYLFNDLIIFAKGMHHGLAMPGKSSTLGIGSKFSIGTKKSFGILKKQSASNLGTGKGDRGVMKPAYRLDLLDCELKLVSEPDAEGFYCFTIKYIERTSEVDVKTGSSKVLTNIHKYEAWCASKDDQESLFNEINDLIHHQEDLAEGQKKAEAEVGNATIKAKRSWREKASARSIDQIKSKYAQNSEAA